MSADDQVFLDVLSSIPSEVRKYSGDVADYIDKHVESVAGVLRDQLSSAQWLPEAVRPRPTPPGPASSSIVPLSTYRKIEDWICRHKYLIGLVTLATSTIVYRSYRRNQFYGKPRRARRARNGGRLDVVVIAGKPTLPLTRSLALDLERKGHIVFIVCNSVEDELIVQNLARPDIKALGLDITDPPSAGALIDRFAQFLQVPHAPVSKAKPNYLNLKAVILIPSLSYQTSPIATIPPSSFADLFNTHLLHPILTIQAFLPILTSRLGAQAQPTEAVGGKKDVDDTARPPKVLVFTPSIISSINPPFHAPEATVCSALSAFTEVLSAELSPLSIPVTHVQLGTFDFASFTPSSSSTSVHSAPRAALMPGPAAAAGAAAEERTWPEGARQAYGRNYSAQAASATAGRGTVFHGLRGSPLRELHNTVFDIVHADQPPSVVRVGLGAELYGFVGRWAPRGLVAWMMGVRPVHNLVAWQPASKPASTETSPESHSEVADYVAVPDDEHGPSVADPNPWGSTTYA